MKAFFAAVALACVAGGAWAQVAIPCRDRAGAVDYLAMNFGESLQSAGLSKNGLRVEIWGNSATGTWTTLTVNPEGMACVMDSGQGFEAVKEPSGVPG